MDNQFCPDRQVQREPMKENHTLGLNVDTFFSSKTLTPKSAFCTSSWNETAEDILPQYSDKRAPGNAYDTSE